MLSSFKLSDKELVEVRNRIFLERGIPRLKQNGFAKSPFSTSWFGRNNLGDYTYELCRLSEGSVLEFITTEIIKGDRWIQIFLNIFKLLPPLSSLDQLIGLEGTHYDLPPNSKTKMRLRCDDYKGPPIFHMLFLPKHKIKCFHSRSGFEKRVKELGDLIEKDMTNIDRFVKRWHELHEPSIVEWEGKRIE